MRKWIEAALLAAMLATAGACAKAENEGAQPAETETGQAEGETQAEAQLADEDLPVQTDFEEEAAQQITADNYQAELEALEKEINSGE